MPRRLWCICLGHGYVRTLLHIVKLPRGLFIPIAAIIVPMVATTMSTWIRWWLTSHHTFALTTIIIAAGIICGALLCVLLLILIPTFAFTTLLLTLHVTNFHRHYITACVIPTTTTVTIAFVFIWKWPKTDRNILSIVYSERCLLSFAQCSRVT